MMLAVKRAAFWAVWLAIVLSILALFGLSILGYIGMALHLV